MLQLVLAIVSLMGFGFGLFVGGDRCSLGRRYSQGSSTCLQDQPPYQRCQMFGYGPPHSSGLFSPSSTYHLLSQSSSYILRLSDQVLEVIDKVQKSFAPSKVLAFSWQLLLDRVPTQSNFFSRGSFQILPLFCAFCAENSLNPPFISYVLVALTPRSSMLLSAGWVMIL